MTKLITVSQARQPVYEFDIHSLIIDPQFLLSAAVINDIEEAELILRQTSADLILIDADTFGTKSIDLIGLAKRVQPHINVIVIAAEIEKRQLLESVAAGATGYLSKAEKSATIAYLLHDFLSNGNPPFSNRAVQQVLAVLQNHNCVRKPAALTDRETEILSTMAKGYSYKETARKLDISQNTVPSHIKNIYRKLGVKSRGEAVFEALQQGVIKLA